MGAWCEQVPAARLQAGVYRCHAPPHEAGTVGLCVTYGDGRPRSNVQPFTYRGTPLTARAQDDLCVALVVLPVLIVSPSTKQNFCYSLAAGLALSGDVCPITPVLLPVNLLHEL